MNDWRIVLYQIYSSHNSGTTIQYAVLLELQISRALRGELWEDIINFSLETSSNNFSLRSLLSFRVRFSLYKHHIIAVFVEVRTLSFGGKSSTKQKA